MLMGGAFVELDSLAELNADGGIVNLARAAWQGRWAVVVFAAGSGSCRFVKSASLLYLTTF